MTKIDQNLQKQQQIIKIYQNLPQKNLDKT